MNSGSILLNGSKAPAQPDWRGQFEEWRQLLEKCGEKPTAKRVHSLRVATLRLMAELDFWLIDQDREDPAAAAALRWSKQAEKVRKALSPVRNSDVYLEMLKKLRSVGGFTESESHLVRAYADEIEKVEDLLERKRAFSEKDLLVEVKRRKAKLVSGSRKLENDLLIRTIWAGSDRIRIVRGFIASLAAEIPSLNAHTLHEFRKRAKRARYLFEVPAKNSAHARRQVGLLKKIQSAIGEWHDWQALASHASRVLESGESDGLVKTLTVRADESLQSALKQCQEVSAQLLVQSSINEASTKAATPRKPLRSIKSVPVKEDRRYA